MRSKQLVVVGLAGFALAWVGLLSLIRPAYELDKTARPFPKPDGSVKLALTRVDHRVNPQPDGTNKINVSLSVKADDAQGKTIGALGETDFEVYENGKRVAVGQFESAGQQAVRACMVIDHSGSMNDAADETLVSKMEAAKKAAIAFLAEMKSKDSIGLLLFDSVLSPLPVAPLDGQFRKEVETLLVNLRPGGGTRLYTAISDGLDLMKNVEGRRILLVLTDGIAEDGSDSRRAVLIKKSQEQNVPLFMVGLGRPGQLDEPAMKEFATGSKGEYLYAPDAATLNKIYSRVGVTLQNEYGIAYESPHPNLDGAPRDIVVRVFNGGSADEAKGEYRVQGVVSTGAGAASPTATPSGTAAPADEGGAPFLGIFLPLAAILGTLFAVPYLREMKGPSTPSPSAPPPPVAPKVVVPPPPQPTAPVAPKAVAPPPVAPPVAPKTVVAPPPVTPPPAPPAPLAPNVCPKCRKQKLDPGPVGQRWCMRCDENV